VPNVNNLEKTSNKSHHPLPKYRLVFTAQFCFLNYANGKSEEIFVAGFVDYGPAGSRYSAGEVQVTRETDRLPPSVVSDIIALPAVTISFYSPTLAHCSL
jgi:hypothetical protein